MGELAAGIAHELGKSLDAIRGRVELQEMMIDNHNGTLTIDKRSQYTKFIVILPKRHKQY
ncbi:MAG: hypothetical protein KA715_09200 [Xanthomonadaceae bacterium]|nr:hypothetical protein [Xanthomonadaceae bacterium]